MRSIIPAIAVLITAQRADAESLAADTVPSVDVGPAAEPAGNPPKAKAAKRRGKKAVAAGAPVGTLAPAAAAVPTSAPEAREFPKQKDALVLCGMQGFWDPDQGLNPGFTVELFALLHADPKLRATIWLPSDWNDRARRLFQSVSDLSMQDSGFRDRHGFKPTVLREYASYERRIGFFGVSGADQQPGRVTLHHPNGIDVTVVRCDAVRGALAWAVEEKSRQAVAGVGEGIRPADRAVALAIATAAPPLDASAPVVQPEAPSPGGVPVVAAAPPPTDPPTDTVPAAALPPPVVAAAEAPSAAAPAASLVPAEDDAAADHAEAQAARDAGITGILETLTTSLRVNPNDLALQERWVVLATQAERCADVMPVYLRIAEGSKKPEVHQAGAACAEDLRQPRETFLALERYVRTSPRYSIDTETYASLAEGFETLGERGRATNYFEEFLRDSRSVGTPRWARAKAYVEESGRLHVDCLIRRRIVVRPRAVQVGGQWVSAFTVTPAQLATECK